MTNRQGHTTLNDEDSEEEVGKNEAEELGQSSGFVRCGAEEATTRTGGPVLGDHNVSGNAPLRGTMSVVLTPYRDRQG